ncbi:MAG TPA: outer membrane lipoprotein carrier protein LolA [Xanthobacteraceae bacterium]|jgi:outer membrane lipoprotein-sorting protein|nr:outer membrane lipoprotein carrier protein LolA [Xanthobacteraceae bacterium]
MAKLGPATAIVAFICGLAVLGSTAAFAENVPLPTPAPLPKTGAAPASSPAAGAGIPIPPASIPSPSIPQASPAAQAASPPTSTPSFFPFSDKGASNQATAFDGKQRALLERISVYLSSVQTMVGNFVQIGPDGNRTEGTFYLQKPGRIRFEYNPPSPIDIVSDGSSVVVRDRKLATQDLYPLSQTPLRYLLADRIDLLRDTDVTSVTSDDTFDSVTIEQKQLMIGTDKLMIMFDAKDLTLKQWTVTDPQGFDTTVAVYNLDTSKKPDPNLFVINYQNNRGGISDQ